MSIQLHLDPDALRRLTRELVDPAVKRAALIVRERTKKNIQKARRVDTGAMIRSIQIARVEDASWIVFSDKFYTVWQEFGRGPVVPVRAKYLRFKPKGAKSFVFAKRVGPVAPAYFMTNAFKSLSPADFR